MKKIMSSKVQILLLRSSFDPRTERIVRTLCSVKRYDVRLLAWDRSSESSSFFNLPHSCQQFIIRFRAPYGALFVFFLFPWFLLVGFSLIYKADIVHACDFDTLMPVLVVKKLFRRKFKVIYDVFDLYAYRVPSFLREFFYKTELLFMSMADAVIICDELRKAEIKGANIRKLEVIMNIPDEHVSLPLVIKKLNAALSQRDNVLTIFYAGVLSFNSGLIQVCEAIKHMKDIRLVVAGYGPQERWFRSFFKKYHNAVFLGKIPHHKVISMTLSADVIVVLRKPVSVSRFSNPNKFFEALMCGKPVIVSKGTGIDRVVQNYQCGFVVNYGDLPSLRKVISKLKQDPELRVKLGANGRKAYESKYNWDLMKEKLLQLYDLIFQPACTAK